MKALAIFALALLLVSGGAIFGKHFPAITLVEVAGLYNPDCMVEISGLAVID